MFQNYDGDSWRTYDNLISSQNTFVDILHAQHEREWRHTDRARGSQVQVRPGAAGDLPVVARQRQGGGMEDGADWEIVLQRGHLIGTLPSQLLRLPLEWERVLRMKRKAVQSLLVRRLPSSLFSFLREAWNRRSCRNVKERCIDNIDLCNYENLCQDLTSWTKKDHLQPSRHVRPQQLLQDIRKLF